jgi:hypothetical protein
MAGFYLAIFLSCFLLCIEFEIVASQFQELGCKEVESRPGEVPRLDCSASEQMKAFSCWRIEHVPEPLHGLKPRPPLVQCVVWAEESLPKEGVLLSEGCGMLPIYINYVVLIDDQPRLISTREAFQKIFAPVENGDEAIAFAAALSGNYPRTKIEIPSGYLQMSDDLKPTFAIKEGDGFKVRLFGFQCEGCAEHPYYFIEYQVTNEGKVIQLIRKDIYRNPLDDGRCMD